MADGKKIRHKIPTAEDVKQKFQNGYKFKQQIGLYDNVSINENFFIGKQWEGVQSNGLPTPTYNFLKQIVNFTVSTITSDNLALKVSPMPGIGTVPKVTMETYCKVINNQYVAIMERNRITQKLREFLRNSAVDGDGCMYFHFDPSIENGQLVKGDIVAEVIQNTRVHFGNPNRRDVQSQPYIIVSQRMIVDDVRDMADEYKESGATEIMDSDSITPDSEVFDNPHDQKTDDKVTVLKYFFRRKETGTIWCMDVVEAGVLRKAYDTRCKRYPFVWHCWDYVQDSYHGQALITGLIPNQVFLNKMYALVGISLLSVGFPKIVYDATRIKRWDGGVGSAVGVNGNVDNVANVIAGAGLPPQIAQFMQMALDTTKSLNGATDVALGDSRPDNTSAIIALQRAANTPMEMTKQAMYQCVEEMGLIWLDIMSTKYGKRKVEMPLVENTHEPMPLGMEDLKDEEIMQDFDFANIANVVFNVQQDAGASSYWSEIANMQTLDNLLMNKEISLLDYLERVPSGYISEKQKLIDKLRGASMPPALPPNAGTGVSKDTMSTDIEVQGGPGNGALQRALNREGV